jgi:hypothetical protein
MHAPNHGRAVIKPLIGLNQKRISAGKWTSGDPNPNISLPFEGTEQKHRMFGGSMYLNEGRHQSRQLRPAIDTCKVDRLKKLARETELLAMELVCELYGSVNGSGHQEPPVPGDETTNGNGNRIRSARLSPPPNDSGPTTQGAGHQEPPVPIVDALVSMAYGAKKICDSCDTLA